jgi:23S rRNA (cytosine1962-C5)-methyltransferase
MTTLKLLPGKEKSVQRRHPWIFSGALQTKQVLPQDGEVVTLTDHKGNFVARGHYQAGSSIAVRVLSFEDILIDRQFYNQIIAKALVYRKSVGIIGNNDTNAYRLLHGEGDGVPGLIVDIYHDIAVIQVHSSGMSRQIEFIVGAIQSNFGDTINTVYFRSEEGTGAKPNGFLVGIKDEVVVLENSVRFKVNVVTGQKTGFFLDQRENRALVGSLSKDKSVLNCFCYTGGFSMYALANGAAAVHSVDISQKAMDLLEENLAINGFSGNHTGHCANVLSFLNSDNIPAFDIVIVDPPAFAKSLNKRHNAIQAYKIVNEAAMKKVKPGGFLLTFSCSQVVGTQLFHDTIMAACIESGRKVRIVKHLSQGADHPVNIYHPEGHYLKGLLLYIED